MNTRKAAGIVLFTRKHPVEFLLMKHGRRWDLPKGHAEEGENMRQTALRETHEETGIAPDLIELDPDFSYEIEYHVQGKKRGDYLKKISYFLGYVAEAYEVLPTEHPGYQWLKWPVPPIQAQTIDPLLTAIAEHFRSQNS